MGEISSCGLPILLRYKQFRITFPFSIQMQIISNMNTFQMEGKSLEECLETTSALFHPLPGHFPDLQVYRLNFESLPYIFKKQVCPHGISNAGQV